MSLSATENESSQGHQSFLRIAKVCDRTGLSKSKIYQLIQDDLFPKQLRIAGGTIAGWSSTDVQAWIDREVESARDAAG